MSLFSILNMQSALDYQMGDDFPFGSPCIRFNVPKGNVPSDKQKCQPKAQHEFIIKGMKITAASKKDAIKKYNHKKNQVSPVWVSVKDRLPPVDKEAVVLTTDGEICFGHIVDKKIAKDYNGWNIPNVEYWLPFVDPKDK